MKTEYGLMSTVSLKNVSTTNNKPEISKRDTINAGLCWFAVDMAVGTAADVFHCSKSKPKLTAKIFGKQAGINALWAVGSACLFAYPLAEIYEYAKQKKYEEFSKLSTAATSILMGFRLYVAARKHPKWKNIRFGDFF